MGEQVFRWCTRFSMRGGSRGVRGSMGEGVSSNCIVSVGSQCVDL